MLKKLSSIPWKTLLLELLIVFVGVFLAFEFNTFSENQKVRSEKEKIMTSLKNELDVIGLSFGNMGAFQKSKVAEWDSLLRIEQFGDFYDWRYIQPQYNYAVLEYALDTRDSRIIDFQLYEKLVKVYQEIKKLEYAENLMTEWGGQFNNMPTNIDAKDADYQYRVADNRFAFYKFTKYAADRASILQRLPEYARAALELVNKEFSPKQRLELEKEVLRTIASRIGTLKDSEVWETVQNMASTHYTHISESEWEALRQELLAESD